MAISERKKTRRINVGGVDIGGGAPVVIQSMTNTSTEDVRATVLQIRRLEKVGCEVVRVAIPHQRALAALPEIKKKTRLPVIADIHFRKDFAIGALNAGADCVRVNPGNLGGVKAFQEVVKAAFNQGRAVRIGVNAGSLEKELLAKKSFSQGEKLVESALRYVERAEKCGLHDIKVSLKSFEVPATVEACRLFSSRCDVPLHIGITEAGDSFSGSIRSAVGLGVLLSQGIGDTMRVSLTAPPEKEIEACWEILGALELRRRGLEVVSCPTCGRCEANVEKLVRDIKKKFRGEERPMRIAVMGCEVNGPGEAASADLGVALNRSGGGVLFVKGNVVRKLASGDVAKALEKEINIFSENE